MKVDSFVRAGACALAVFGCSSAKHPAPAEEPDAGSVGANAQPDPGTPTRIGSWTYYGEGQGLSKDVRDISPDEGGNLYVAGGDALYAKQRSAEKESPNAMNREQWMWMRASVALVAAAVASMKHAGHAATLAESMRAMPQTVANPS